MCEGPSVDPRVAELSRTSPVSCLNRDGGGEEQGSLKDGDYCKLAVCLFFACAISSIFILSNLRDLFYSPTSNPNTIPITIIYDNTSVVHAAASLAHVSPQPDLVSLLASLDSVIQSRGQSASTHHVHSHTGNPFNEISDSLCTYYMKYMPHTMFAFAPVTSM